jgi:hypothetical protein
MLTKSAFNEPPSPAGGTSIMIGPASFVLRNAMKYSVSGFGVSVWRCQSSGRPQ